MPRRKNNPETNQQSVLDDPFWVEFGRLVEAMKLEPRPTREKRPRAEKIEKGPGNSLYLVQDLTAKEFLFLAKDQVKAEISKRLENNHTLAKTESGYSQLVRKKTIRFRPTEGWSVIVLHPVYKLCKVQTKFGLPEFAVVPISEPEETKGEGSYLRVGDEIVSEIKAGLRLEKDLITAIPDIEVFMAAVEAKFDLAFTESAKRDLNIGFHRKFSS